MTKKIAIIEDQPMTAILLCRKLMESYTLKLNTQDSFGLQNSHNNMLKLLEKKSEDNAEHELVIYTSKNYPETTAFNDIEKNPEDYALVISDNDLGKLNAGTKLIEKLNYLREGDEFNALLIGISSNNVDMGGDAFIAKEFTIAKFQDALSKISKNEDLELYQLNIESKSMTKK